jgi:hypothetical protein
VDNATRYQRRIDGFVNISQKIASTAANAGNPNANQHRKNRW